MDSSFIISPLSPELTDVWSEPELLSSKGYNAIYVATRFGRRYILKAIAEQFREATPYIELLRKEFSIGVGLDHPNVVRVLDFGYMESIGWYIQMEYIDGITLEQFLHTPSSAAIRRKLLNQLLDALSFLHKHQIIHRDIKPSNILITRNGTTVKLIDFGVSDTDDYVTFKQPAGSMAYIAPEQLAGKTIDNRADIYAVGKIILLLFPHRYRCIARKCTHPNPLHRYSSCTHVARAIRRFDNLCLWLPLSMLFLLIPCAAIWGTYIGLQPAGEIHFEQESELFAHIDSLRAENTERQSQVDSLNRVVDSLKVKANTPSPRELMQRKARQVHAARYAAMRAAVKKGEIKAKWELSNMNWETRDSEFDRALATIEDPFMKEAFREAYFAIALHERNPLYDSLYNALPEKAE